MFIFCKKKPRYSLIFLAPPKQKATTPPNPPLPHKHEKHFSARRVLFVFSFFLLLLLFFFWFFHLPIDIWITPLVYFKKKTPQNPPNVHLYFLKIYFIHYDKFDDFEFPIILLGWMMMFLDSHRNVFTFRSYLDYLGVVPVFLDFHYKSLQLTSKHLTQVCRYHKLRKQFGKLFRSYSEFFSKLGEINVSFQKYVSEGISRPGF